MSIRKWMVRGLVFGVATVAASVALVYERCTNPTAMRQQVIAKIGDHLVNVVVGLDSAQLRLLGGIAFSELRLRRGDDPDKNDFMYVPSGVIYHDKELLLDGQVSIRRIELHRPLIRALRRPDGRWNLAGILQPPELDKRKPTIVIQQGTILIDEGPNVSPLEIKDVSLTLINDPILTLAFQATGRSDLLGSVQALGNLQRDTDQFRGSVKARAVPLSDALTNRLVGYAPELRDYVGRLQGIGTLVADFNYDPDPRNPIQWSHSVHCQIAGGSFEHEKLPLPLSGIETAFHLIDGQLVVEKMIARAGNARLSLEGKALALNADADFDGTFAVDDLRLDRDLLTRLPNSLQEVQTDYQPDGLVSFKCDLRRRAGQYTRRLTISPKGLKAVFLKFPYPLSQVAGTLEQTVDPDKHLDVFRIDLTALAGNKPIRVRGQLEGEKPAGVILDIWGSDLEIDESLIAALPPGPKKITRSFHPKGRLDLVASIRRPQGHQEFSNSFRLRFHDASVQYDVFPYPIEQVSGELDIQPDHWSYTGFQGSHNGAELRSEGRSEHTPEGERIRIEVSGKQVLLDDELAASLQPGLKQAWGMLQPAGRIEFVARVDHLLSKPEPEFDVSVRPLGCSLNPRFFPYPLENVRGSDKGAVKGGDRNELPPPDWTIRYKNKKVFLNEIQASHGLTRLTLHEGDIEVKPEGRVCADIRDLEGARIIPDADFLAALPPVLRGLFNTLQFRDAFSLRTQLIVDIPAGESTEPPSIRWDGGIRVVDASLHTGVQLDRVTGDLFCRGNYRAELQRVDGHLDLKAVSLFNQPVRDIQSNIHFGRDKEQALTFRDLKASLFNGDVGGEVRVEFTPKLNYELFLRASRLQLEELGRQNLMPSAEISGLAVASLSLGGTGDGMESLRGHGSVDVPNGRMYNLPLLLDLIKVLGLRLPDRTAFEEAHTRFTIQGPRVHIDKVDLLGNAVSLSGKGDMNLDGTDINLDFYAVVGRVKEFLPPVIREIPPLISECLLKIRMQGQVGNVRCTKQLLPPLFDPFRNLYSWMQQRQARQYSH